MGSCVDKCWADLGSEFNFEDKGLPLQAIITGDIEDFEKKYRIDS